MSAWEFPTDSPVDLQVRIASGHVTVSAAATGTATVRLSGNRPGTNADAARVEFDQGTLSVSTVDGPWPGRHGSVEVTVQVPQGSSCLVETVSADVRCTGELATADIRTVSGDIEAERVSGLAQAHTASGDVHVGAAGAASVEATSGDVSIGRVGDATIRTASGDVGIDTAAGSQVEVKSSSGDIGVGVTPGIGVYLDLSSVSGTVSSELEPAEGADEAQMTLSCRSISGEVRVSSARQVADRAANQV
jgi:Putative adhesin